MKTKLSIAAIAVFALILLVSCVSVRRQTSSVGFQSAPGCRTATVNGKDGNACIICEFCPKGKPCWVEGASGFLEKCPKK